MGIDIGFQNNARYWKLVHIKVTNWWYQRYLNGLAVMFFLPRFFLAWYFKCPELTQPLSHDSSKNQTAYQKDIVEQNLAQLFIWTGIHCFVSSINWFRLCKTKYVTDVSGTDEIFAHMLLHSVEKPFLFKQCNYSFTWGQHLKEHIFRHTGEKPYACQHCSYSCSHPEGLKYHMLSHTGEKPFLCITVQPLRQTV